MLRTTSRPLFGGATPVRSWRGRKALIAVTVAIGISAAAAGAQLSAFDASQKIDEITRT